MKRISNILSFSPQVANFRPSLSVVGIILTGFLFVAQVDTIQAVDPEAWAKQYLDEVFPIVKAKCVNCHGKVEPDAGIDLESLATSQQILEQNELWSMVGKRVRLNEMPPQGSPRLHDPEKALFLRWIDSSPKQDLCNQLASDETQAWYRGYVMSRRLTQTEYNYVIRDLIGVDLKPGRDLPSDGAGGEGFDTSGVTLFTSPIHLEKYLTSADEVIETVLPDEESHLSEPLKQARKKLLAPLNGFSGEPREAARKVITPFVNQAYRRPVSEEEIQRLLSLFDQTYSDTGNQLSGIRQALKGILVSPYFLFVSEQEGDGGIQRLTPHEFAARLALLIWSSMPDSELRQLADQGATIFEPDVIKAQIKRMLADEKSRALGDNFTMQWLGLDKVGRSVRPDPQSFPEFNDSLAESMKEEVILTATEIFRQNRSLLELIDAQEVIINAELAELYQLPKPARDWERVNAGQSRRGGMLTTAAMLTSTSYPQRTSPILRGTWVLENLLGERVPPPPPDVPALEENSPDHQELTFRQRLELHRRDPKCASCHDRIDPLGFSLEQFDVLGRYRQQDEKGQPIDASGKLSSGREFQGSEGLKSVLMSRKKDVMKHLTRKMLGFALGRELNKFDACVIDETLKTLEANDYQAHLLLEQIVLSYPFQHRYFK